MRLVQLTGIEKTYTMPGGAVSVPVLRGIDLSIERGEYVAIMGPSGSGKTTLLNLIGCLDRPTRGRYLLGHKDISQLNDNALSDIRCHRLGFVFQAYNLIPELSVLENIGVPLFYQGLGERALRRRARELALQVGLGDRLKHLPAALSGGQQQRVAIARALANDPMLILGDEPTGNLDSGTGNEILDMFDTLHRDGRTLLIVTHDDAVAARAGRIVRMKDGTIREDNHNAPRQRLSAARDTQTGSPSGAVFKNDGR